MKTKDLENTIRTLMAPAKGILAADESDATIARRFEALGIESTEESRRHYRQMFFTTPDVEEYICGVILFDETLQQRADDGRRLVEILAERDSGEQPIHEERAYILSELPDGDVGRVLDLPQGEWAYAAEGHFANGLLTVLEALPTLTAETPYRVFSVRVFNDSKRLESIKRQLVTLARLGNPGWKRIPAEEVLRELNLVANPNYIHFSGNWQLTTRDGEILNLSGFAPSVGFPAAQTSSLQSVHAESVLCIENLTTFHQYTQQVNTYTGTHVDGTRNTEEVNRYTRTQVKNGTCTTQHREVSPWDAILCTYGNPSPAVRRILRLVPESVPIYLWSDLDYGGFNILSQLRRTVDEKIQPFLMDIDTIEANILRARPLTASDRTHIKRLLLRPELRDIRPVIEHLLKRGLKLEQEGVEIF